MKTFCPRHDNRKREWRIIQGGESEERRGGNGNDKDAAIDKTDEDNISEHLAILDIKVNDVQPQLFFTMEIKINTRLLSISRNAHGIR